MNLRIALGSMRLLASMGHKGMLDGLGVSKGDFLRLVGDDPWTASERTRMGNLLHVMANCSIDAQGLPRFALPAEYLAAVITMFCKGVNVMAACNFAPPAIAAADAGRGNGGAKSCTPSQLFALVLDLYSDPGSSQARAMFEKNTKLELDKVKSDDVRSLQEVNA